MNHYIKFVVLVCIIATLANAISGTNKPRNNKQHPDALPNQHRPGEVDIAANLKYCEPDPSTLPGIVLDETNAILVGAWQYSTHTPPYVGYGYLHDRKTGKGAKKVIYQFHVIASGKYDVRMSHCYNVRRATNTSVTVKGPDLLREVKVNQQTTPEIGKLWRSLGSFLLKANESYQITISNKGTEGKYVIADAFHILPLKTK